MAITRSLDVTDVTNQLTPEGPEVASCTDAEIAVSYTELDAMESFSVLPVATSDGEGGVDIHSSRMIKGYPYTLDIAGIPLVAVRESDDSVTLYGLPGNDG